MTIVCILLSETKPLENPEQKNYLPILRSCSDSSTTMQFAMISYAALLWSKKKTVKQAGKKKANEKFFITDRTRALK